jgi:hypothetical protein
LRGQINIRELLTQKFKIVFSISDKVKLLISILIWFLLSLPLSAIFFSMEIHYELLGERTISLAGRERITLNPQNWINKKFPLTQHFQRPFDESIDIKNVRTIILIVRDVES